MTINLLLLRSQLIFKAIELKMIVLLGLNIDLALVKEASMMYFRTNNPTLPK